VQAVETLSVKEAIESRRSIRKFKPEPIPREELDEILRLASFAPSAWNLQPWRFIVVTDPSLKEALQAAANNQPQVTSAPAVILLASDMEDVLEHVDKVAHPSLPPEQQQRFADMIRGTFGGQSVEQRGAWAAAQCYIALGFLLIAAQSMGYATVPMLGFDPVRVREILGLPDHVQLPAMVPIGRPAEEGRSRHRHRLEDIVTYR
jgi:nitroreductase